MSDWERIGTRGVLASMTRMAYLFSDHDYREHIAVLAEDRYRAGALIYGSSSWLKTLEAKKRERDEEVADMTVYDSMIYS